MDLKNIIRRILKEESEKKSAKERVIDLLEKRGLKDTIKLVGGYDRFKFIVGDIKLSVDDKITSIQEDYIEICEAMGENPDDGIWLESIQPEKIRYSETDDMYSVVEILHHHYAVMYWYRKDNDYSTDEGSFREYHYEYIGIILIILGLLTLKIPLLRKRKFHFPKILGFISGTDK